MPFIAIALALSALLGGSAAFAATTPAGHAAVESATHMFSHIKADVIGSSDTRHDINAAGNTYLAGSEDSDATDTPSSITAHGALRVRDDADTGAKAQDDKVNADAAAHAGVEVNVY